MTETLHSLAETPDSHAAAGPDLLSEMLSVVRLTGSVFLNASFTTPFGIVDPRAYAERTPMARLRHASILHLIVAGGCDFESGGERRSVRAGDILFQAFPDAYQFWSGKPEGMTPASDVVRPSPIEGLWTVGHGGGGEEVRMVCGFLESSEFLFTPVFRTLPSLIVEQMAADRVGSLIAATVREIVALVDAATPGTQAILGRLMELLFVEILRRHIARLPREAGGWFAALNDPVVGRSLRLIHADPARRWTIEEMAGEVGTSRSVLTGRFKALLGRPPVDYATGWRIQIAADRLRVGRENLAGIAAGVGYESEAAFIRAFKRVTGTTPGAWREASPAMPPAWLKGPAGQAD
jgi:AraC-like DNA-binding protein